ncbi:MAG: cysteine desulfurase [Chthonomonas sp.]|nr:cysteine desulfurase [Chthonomonas sp.]
MERIYLDHAATTPLDPRVREAMLPWLSEFGNPSSLSLEGRRARAAIDEAREISASRLGCLFGEVHFLASGTESCNLALLGCARAALQKGIGRPRILASAVEHHAVLHTAPILAELGFTLETVAVDRLGRVDLDALSDALRDDVLLVSVMTANNELGTRQPIEEISRLTREVGAYFHTDAIQTLGCDSATADQLGCDLLSATAHKFYGPKGAALLYVRSGTPMSPIVVGGGQEREQRAGTENVMAIVGLGEAIKVSGPDAHVSEARDAFYENLDCDWVRSVLAEIPCLAGHAHVRFPSVSAETLLIKLDRMGISASSGAACSSGSIEPSHVLLACGLPESEARECVRFTFGKGQDAEIGARAAKIVSAALAELN